LEVIQQVSIAGGGGDMDLDFQIQEFTHFVEEQGFEFFI
jgi:hypothetical protein